MGLKVFTNSKVKKPRYCNSGNYIPAGMPVPSALMLPDYDVRTSGKGIESCCHLCSEQRSHLFFGGVNEQELGLWKH